MARFIFACRRTVAGRLYLVGGLALAAVVLLAAVSIYFALTTRQAAHRLYQSGLMRAVEAAEIELFLEKHRRFIELAALAIETTQMSRDRIAAAETAGKIEALVGAAGAALAAKIAPALDDLWASGEDVLRTAVASPRDGAPLALARYVARAKALQEAVRSHRTDRMLGAYREVNTLAGSAWSLVNSVTGISLMASLLIGPLSFVLLRGMVRRFESLTQGMRRLANNDTAIDISGVGDRDEIGEMVRAMAVFKNNAVQLLDQQNQLEQLNRRLDIALNNMGRGLSMFDGEHRLIVCNAAYIRMYHLPEALTEPGVSLHQILQHRRAIVTSLDEPDDMQAGGEIQTLHDGASQAGAVAKAIETFAGARREGQLRQRTIDGRTLDIIVKPLPWGGWVALHEDVTSRVQDAEKITRLARQDTLTGLANRHAFCESLDQATAELMPQETFALLAIDLDRFKDVNDTLGHPTGDALLTSVGARLTDIVRRGDLVARLGGDEFAIIQRGVTCRADAETLARRVIDTLHQPFQILHHRIEIGGTIGISLAPQDGVTSGELMKNADIALYRAKGERRGTFHFYDPAMEGRLRSRRALEADLGKAVARGELELHYQPIVSLADGKVSGCEALIRWRHSHRGLISPADFIPMAEDTGLICEIGAWALEEACMAAQRWPSGLRVAVNLSPAQFNGPDLAVIAAMALERSGLAPARLELEVTESLLLGDDPATLALMHRLRDLGLGIALDDFGTGYSSLSHLRSFPFDKIKIDQTFVRDLPQRRNCEAIVGAVARLASSLDMTTVAEGVETEDHLERVRVAGCNEVQGYLFSRPVPEAQIAHVIADIDGRMATGALAA